MKKTAISVVFVLCLVGGLWTQLDWQSSSMELESDAMKIPAPSESPRRHDQQRGPLETDQVADGPGKMLARSDASQDQDDLLRLQGKVLEADRTPVPNVILLLRPIVDGLCLPVSLDDLGDEEDGNLLMRTISAADGSFSFEVEGGGTFECFAYAFGFRPQRQEIVVQPGDSLGVAINLVLEPLGIDTCIVLDEKGLPVPFVPVRIQLSTRQDWEQIPQYIEFCLTSDSEGTFQVAKFPSSAHSQNAPAVVVVRLEHPRFSRLTFKDIGKLPRDNAGRIVLRLEPGRQVSIQFKDVATANRLPHMPFKMKSLFGTWTAKGVTDENGRATLTHVPSTHMVQLLMLSKTWTLAGDRVNAGLPTRILRFSPDQNEDLTISVFKSKTGFGRVVEADSGRPVEGVEVHVAPLGIYEHDLLLVRSQTAVTDENGAFNLIALPSSKMRISIRSQEWQLAELGLGGTGHSVVEFNFHDDNSRNNQVLVSRSASVEGVVRDTQGNCVSGARVSFTRPGKQESAMRVQTPPVAISDADGKFHLQGIPTGQKVYFVVRHVDYAMAQKVRTLSPGETQAHVDFVVSMGATIKVKLIDGDGQPVSGAMIQVAHGGSLEEIPRVNGNSLISTAITTEDGVATFRRLSVGPTTIFFKDSNPTAKRFSNGNPTDVNAQIEIKKGEHRILVKLGPHRYVRGLARRSNGRPNPNAMLTFRAEGKVGKNFERTIRTDLTGQFSFEARLAPKTVAAGSSTFTMKFGRQAEKGEIGWSYELVGATASEQKQPSRVERGDTMTLTVIRSPRAYPRSELWEFVFAD